ncbi:MULTISPECIES: RidA family protein [unclassified Streptomyces]|uniref:RidA family protein n=1 Tax=unclassified Streptomyces TaxID=2593676 RepID=UPI00332EB944
MSLHRHNPAELAPPAGFSHAVTANGSRLVFLSGQRALDSTGAVVGTTLAEQFATALGNLLVALRHAGGGPADLTRVTVYTTDVAAHGAQSAELSRIWRRMAGRDYPAMTVVEVVRLREEGALVELDGIAVLEEPGGA